MRRALVPGMSTPGVTGVPAHFASPAGGAKPLRFARKAWGDQTLEQRMPSFLEAVLFEPEAAAKSGISRRPV